MSDAAAAPSAAELRREFDASFAHSRHVQRTEHEDFLIVRVDKSRVAVRLQHIGSVLRCPPLTAVPSGQASLLGLAAVRSSLVAVYRLAALMGERSASVSGSIFICASDASVAMLFDELSGVVRVPPEAVHAGDAPAGGKTGEIVTVQDTQHFVVDVPGLLVELFGQAQNQSASG